MNHCQKCCENHKQEAFPVFTFSVTTTGDPSFTYHSNGGGCPCECHSCGCSCRCCND